MMFLHDTVLIPVDLIYFNFTKSKKTSIDYKILIDVSESQTKGSGRTPLEEKFLEQDKAQ